MITTFGCAESDIPGAIAIESSSAKSSGRSRAPRRSTASGIAGPSAARAKMNTVSSGATLSFSFGERRTVPRTPRMRRRAASLLASSTFSRMARASSEPGGTSGSMRCQ